MGVEFKVFNSQISRDCQSNLHTNMECKTPFCTWVAGAGETKYCCYCRDMRRCSNRKRTARYKDVAVQKLKDIRAVGKEAYNNSKPAMVTFPFQPPLDDEDEDVGPVPVSVPKDTGARPCMSQARIIQGFQEFLTGPVTQNRNSPQTITRWSKSLLKYVTWFQEKHKSVCGVGDLLVQGVIKTYTTSLPSDHARQVFAQVLTKLQEWHKEQTVTLLLLC